MTKVEKCSSTKHMWEKIQDLYSKGVLTMTYAHEVNGK